LIDIGITTSAANYCVNFLAQMDSGILLDGVAMSGFVNAAFNVQGYNPSLIGTYIRSCTAVPGAGGTHFAKMAGAKDIRFKSCLYNGSAMVNGNGTGGWIDYGNNSGVLVVG
jgi:hypothetical protein